MDEIRQPVGIIEVQIVMDRLMDYCLTTCRHHNSCVKTLCMAHFVFKLSMESNNKNHGRFVMEMNLRTIVITFIVVALRAGGREI